MVTSTQVCPSASRLSRLALSGPGSIQRGLPTVTWSPSTTPEILCPACSDTSSAVGTASAAATMAAASGCVLCCSTAAPYRNTMSSCVLSTGITAVTLGWFRVRSEEHTSELRSRGQLVCRLLLEKKKNEGKNNTKII